MNRRLSIVGAMVLLAVAASANAQSSVLVMPFDNVTRDARIFWIGEAAAVLVTDDVNALGGSAITRQERQQAFERLQVPPAASLTDATIIRIGQLVGAAQVVVGTVQLDGDDLVAHARTITLDTAKVAVDVTERGPLPEMFGTFERIARRIAAQTSGVTVNIPLQHAPIAVFENYIKGILAEDPETAMNYLNSALKLQPTFDRARLALWELHTDKGDYEEALPAVEGVQIESSFAARARFLAGLSLLDLARYDDAFRTFKGLADPQAAAAVANNLGVVQLRRGGATPEQTGVPTFYFTKAVEADPDDADYLFNLGYAYWLARDAPAAIYWLREAVRRNRADADAHFVLGTAFAATGNATEAARERELARRLSADYESRDTRRPAPNTVDGVPRGLERVKPDIELRGARGIETRLAATGQRDQEEQARFYLDRGRRLFEQEQDRDAMSELDRALYLSPYLAEAHLLLGRIHLRNGRVQDAINALKISVWSAETAAAHAVLGEAYRQNRDLATAREEANRALAMDPSSAEAKQLLARIEGR
jgi:tetratricopeptide (TPR) repeat protein